MSNTEINKNESSLSIYLGKQPTCTCDPPIRQTRQSPNPPPPDTIQDEQYRPTTSTHTIHTYLQPTDVLDSVCVCPRPCLCPASDNARCRRRRRRRHRSNANANANTNMSSRLPTQPDKRVNGSGSLETNNHNNNNFHSNHNNYNSQNDGPPRPRARVGRSESRPSPSHHHQHQQSYTNPPHKRSASGNPRPVSRSHDERRTERTTVATKEKLVSRTRSGERRPRERETTAPPPEKWKMKDPATTKTRPPDTRSREPRQDAPPGTFAILFQAELCLCFVLSLSLTC